MNAFVHVFSPGRCGTLLGISGALVVLTWLRWPEAAPVTPVTPVAGLQSDLPAIGTVSHDIVPASEAQRAKIEKLTETEAVDEWIRVSPRRAQLMSREAMAGYEPILAALDLSPSQHRRLKQLIVERAESASDADQLGKENRLSSAQTLFLRNEAEASFDQQSEAIVGSANFQVVRKMLQLAPQLAEIADSVGRELARAGSPLDADQMLQLAQLYKMVYASDPAGRAVDRKDGFDAAMELSHIDRQTLAQASALLTPAQRDTLQRPLATTITSYATSP